MSKFELLQNINDIDDDLVFEAEQWQRPKIKKLKIGIIAAAAAALCAITTVTAVAFTKSPQEYVVNGEPIEVDYTVYKDDAGREIRTYAYKLPEFALLKEKPGCTPVGKVRVAPEDGYYWIGWRIIDEAGNEFTNGVNNMEVKCNVIDKYHPETLHDIGFSCANFNSKEYSMAEFYHYLDDDRIPDSVTVYVYRYDDEEEYKRILENEGREYTPEDAEKFRENVERHEAGMRSITA